MENDLAVYDANVAEVATTPISDETLITLAEQAEKRIDAMNKIKRIAIKLTNKHDWVDQGGKPFLQSSGSEKIARMFGISWRISEPIKEQLESGHFSFTYKGYFTLAGATIEAIGTRSSKDGFFKKYGYENGEKKELPASEIDAGDVKKSAFTNLIGNGITRILGIRNMTYEDLQEYANITKDMIGKVDYKKEGKQQTDIKTEGAQTKVITIADIRKQTGTNRQTKKPWTKYVIKDSEGAEYGTFSETMAAFAKTWMEKKQTIEMTFTTSNFGNDIESMKLHEEIKQEGWNDGDGGREPGQEG